MVSPIPTDHHYEPTDRPPIASCLPGDKIILEARDAVDGQLNSSSRREDLLEDLLGVDRNVVHPLTGPIWIEGAQPGDLVAVEIREVVPSSFGYTAQFPGFGFLADIFDEPFLVRWDIAEGFATSRDLPGVRIPGAPFMGTIGVAPSLELLERITARERKQAGMGLDVLLPNPKGAIPDLEPIANTGLRTKPPRENGGNVDIRQAVAGTTLLIPVWVNGALLSIGDGHFAQGDGESCGTAIEVEASIRFRVHLRKGEALERGIEDVSLEGWTIPEDSRPFYATTGLTGSSDSANREDDLNRAVRVALENMISHLCNEYGLTRQQAYALCSVAVNLRVAQIVNSPNHLVTATIFTDIFRRGEKTA